MRRWVRLKIRSDGTPLSGVCKFTPTELVAYCRNMYGANCYRRWTKTNQAKVSPEERSRRGYQANQTRRERYTPEEIHEFMMKAVEKRRKRPDFQEYAREKVRLMHTPEAEAKKRQTVANKEHKIGPNHLKCHRYFICDCEIDGQEFHEGEYLDVNDELYPRANEMHLVYPLNELPDETKRLAVRHRVKINDQRMSIRRWYARRPGLVVLLLERLILKVV